MVVDSGTDKPTRVGYRTDDERQQDPYCQANGKDI